MTTPVTHSPAIDPARKELPPVEKAAIGLSPENATPATAVADQKDEQNTAQPGVAVPTLPPHHPQATHAEQLDVNGPPGPIAKSVAHWIHQHPQAHNRTLFGRTVYQFLRSAAASTPYGLSMAGVLAGLTGMERYGNKLTQAGKSSLTQGIGRNLKGFAGFQPARLSLLIGASFTLYRGTSKLGKWLTEYLFNPKDSEARTAEKVDDLPQELIRKVKEIAPAEAASTPVSAIVLGFIVATFKKPAEIADTAFDWTRKNFLETKGAWNKMKLMGRVLTPKTKFVQHSVINTFGYSLFFELGDRLFKDTQIRRGVWPGEHNSIKALKAAPDEYEQGIREESERNKPKFEDSAIEAVPETHHYKFFTSEPSVGRFLFRRVLPTAVGITAYTAAKMRWGTMLGNNFNYDGKITLKEFGKKSWGEGAATSLFFLIPIVSEPWEKMYDTFFAKKEKVAQLKDQMKEHPEMLAKQATPHQQQKYEELLTRVNAKERGVANDGAYAQRA